MAKKYIVHDEYSKFPRTGSEARENGNVYYYTGKECSKGHVSPRYSSSGNCRECLMISRGKFFNPKNTRRSSEEDQRRALKALSLGEKFYKPENGCRHGHFLRYVSTHNCAECSNIAKQKRKVDSKWSRVMREYGISKQDHDHIVTKQNGKCPICTKDLLENRPHIDHCHNTGKVRGVLCGRCNQAIGLLYESESNMNNAIKYLKENA